MSTRIPGTIHPYPPIPGQPSGVGTFIPGHPYASSGPFGGHATLATDLVSAWPLSADGTDSHGANDLTNNNGVTFVPLGPSGVVADFEATASEHFTTSGTLIAADASFSIAGWMRFESSIESTGAIGVFGDASLNCTITNVNTVRKLTFIVNGGSSGVDTSETLVNNQWYFVVCSHNAATDIISISINNGTPATAATIAPNGAVDNWIIGVDDPLSGKMDGLMGRVGLWVGAVLTTTQISSLYNGGKGKTYEDLTTADKVNLSSFWKMSEAAGNRADSYGSITLTDTNTVTSATNIYPANMPSNVANFVGASSQYFSKADDAGDGLRLGGSYSFAVWVKPTGHAATQMFVAKDYDVVRGYAVYYDTSQQIVHQVGLDGSITQQTSTATLTDNAWNLVIAEFNVSDGKSTITVNGGTSAVSADLGNVPNVMTAAFNVGREAYPGFPFHYTGAESSLLVYSRVLTAGERTDLYASGNGLFY